MNIKEKSFVVSPLWHFATLMWIIGIVILTIDISFIIYVVTSRPVDPPEFWLPLVLAAGLMLAGTIAYWIDDWRKRTDAQTGPDDSFG